MIRETYYKYKCPAKNGIHVFVLSHDDVETCVHCWQEDHPGKKLKLARDK